MYIKDWTSYSIANSWKKKLIMKFVNLIILILGFIHAYEAKTVSEIKISICTQQVFAFLKLMMMSKNILHYSLYKLRNIFH